MEHVKNMYSIEEVIKLSGLGRTKIYEEISLGHLRAKKLGARTLIPAEKYQDWVNALPDYFVKEKLK